MTIEKVRNILQEEVQDLSDDQILDLIQRTGSMCDVILDLFISNLLTYKKKEAYYG